MSRRVKLILEFRNKYGRNKDDKHPRPALRGFRTEPAWKKKKKKFGLKRQNNHRQNSRAGYIYPRVLEQIKN